MEGLTAVVVAGLVLSYSLLARRLQLMNITAPMFAVVAGALVFVNSSLFELDTEAVHVIAEITLVLVLFHDASTVRLRQLRADPWLAVRLLAIGFPLALILTTGAVWLALPAVGLLGALLIAGALTPTDAGLGAPTVLNPEVPVRVRRALNVESGLNDGLATPIVLICVQLLAAEEGVETPSAFSVSVVPVLLALAVAVVIGVLAGPLLDLSERRGWSSATGRQIVVFTLPLFVFGVAEIVGANTFIAAFVAGLVVGSVSHIVGDEAEASELIETASDLLGLLVWFLGGALLTVVFEDGFEAIWIVLAVLILTVLRMVPVALSLLGTGFTPQTVGFLGWFGPRGLASIVFALIAVEELGPDHPVVGPMVGITACTVVLSVFAHGISAGPLSQRYGRWVHSTHAPIERQPGVEPMPSRGRPSAMKPD